MSLEAIQQEKLGRKGKVRDETEAEISLFVHRAAGWLRGQDSLNIALILREPQLDPKGLSEGFMLT